MRVEVIKLYDKVPQVFCNNAQVNGVLAQVQDAQRMVVTVHCQNLASNLVNVVYKLEGGLKFISLVFESVGTLQFSGIFDVADTKSARAHHLCSCVPVRAANVVFAN